MTATIFVLTGPESCAKTSLAEYLANHFAKPLVTEVARHYLNEKPNPTSYLPSDLFAIAQQQQHTEEQALAQTDDFIIADTDLQVLRIWWQVKYGPRPNCLAHHAGPAKRHYLLCAPTIPWQPDPQRESQDQREQIFDLYLQDMQINSFSYSLIDAQGQAREQQAKASVEQHYN